MMVLASHENNIKKYPASCLAQWCHFNLFTLLVFLAMKLILQFVIWLANIPRKLRTLSTQWFVALYAIALALLFFVPYIADINTLILPLAV